MFLLSFRYSNVIPDQAINCQGKPRVASSMKDETEIGAVVKHIYIVSIDSLNHPYQWLSGLSVSPGYDRQGVKMLVVS